MGLLWWGGMALGWAAVGFLGISSLICNVATGGALKKYGLVARSYKTNVSRGGRFG